jgi:drug/metabolite transporter (DMT)-like permease
VTRRGWVLFTAMSVIWGIPYLLIKVADGGVSVPVLVLCRVGVGAALLLPIALRRRNLAVLAPRWRWLALFAVVEIIIPWLLLSEAETRLSSSMSGLLIATVPILVAIISRLTGGTDRLSPVRWAGLLVGLAGVGLLIGPGPLIASRKLSDLPPLPMTAACLAFAAVVYSPLAALTWPSHVPPAKVLASLAGLAVICTALAFVVFFALIAEAGPARASVITYINPAIAVVLGVWLLHERLTGIMAAAFGLILGGSVLATRPSNRTGPATAPQAPAQTAGTGSADGHLGGNQAAAAGRPD